MTQVDIPTKMLPTPTVTQFELGEQYGPHWEEYLNACRIVETFKQRFKQLFTEAGVDEVTLNGKVVATFKADTKFQSALFRKEVPHLANQYMTKQLVDVFDEATFKQVHPDLWEQYRSRSLRPVKQK